MKNTLSKAVIEIIRKISYMNIATVSDNNPWNTPVYCAFDSDLNFYWASWKKNQHSINIRNNPNAFVTIYDSTVKEGQGVGVYLRGEAYELSNPVEVMKGAKLLFDRVNQKTRAVREYFNKYPRRIYKFSPKNIWINGDGDIDGNFVDIRTELNLEEVKKFLRRKT